MMQRDAAAGSERFVPKGVDAQSWIGFEDRILERRFRVLLGTVRASIAAGDMAAARRAFDEAFELMPESPSLHALEPKIGRVVDPSIVSNAGLVRSRALSALMLLACGVSLVTAIDYVRTPHRARTVSPPARAELPGVAHALTLGDASKLELPATITGDAVPAAHIPISTSGLEIKLNGDVSVPASLKPAPGVEPDPAVPPPDRLAAAAPELTVPRSTSDLQGASSPRSGTPTGASAFAAAVADAPVVPPTAPPSAIPSALVVPSSPRTASLPAVAAATIAPRPALTNAGAATLPGGDEARVSELLNTYARAYNQLDASLAHQVWPSVDERALARAFSALSSQSISFADCKISVKELTAIAACRGYATYVGKVGGRGTRTEPRQWRFDLRRGEQGWRIDTVDTRR